MNSYDHPVARVGVDRCLANGAEARALVGGEVEQALGWFLTSMPSDENQQVVASP